MSRRKNKNNVNHFEFRDGYALIDVGELDAVLTAFREGRIRKNELRVYAGLYERSRLYKESKVDLYRIVNHKTKSKGIKRLSHREIDTATEVIESIGSGIEGGPKKAVARRFLRYIARGSATNAEAILLFYFCKRRIRQVRPLVRLNRHERYARFTYREVAEAAGVRRATLCDAMKRLCDRGLLATVPVAKQNENTLGMLYIDGFAVTLSRSPADWNRRQQKTVTPLNENRNATGHKTVTLRNSNPKTSSISLSERERTIVRLREVAQSPENPMAQYAVRELIELELMELQAA
ncbi:hypothetical protein [Aeoliella sp.]|uniref:hypothetical protein n=1 Tax=Aeoliella sp. TaxID=2795800 RepID=UPI003CCC258F